MAFSAKYNSSLTHKDLNRYKKKIEAFCWIDLCEWVGSECSEDVKLWPKITEVDRIDYFVYQTDNEFVTKNSMKYLKSLEAHNFFTNGFVFRPRVKEWDSDLVLVLAKVSERLWLCPFVYVWLELPWNLSAENVPFDISVGNTVWHYYLQ